MALYAVTESGGLGELAMVVPGELDEDSTKLAFLMSHEQTAELLPGVRYEHRMTAWDPALRGIVVLLRGYLTVRDSLADGKGAQWPS